MRSAQGLALEQLHGDEGTALIFIDFVDSADVGMIERRCGARLALESLQSVRVAGGIFRQELERDQTAQPHVFSFVDNTHSARTKLFLDAVVRDNLVVHGAQNSGLEAIRRMYSVYKECCNTNAIDSF